ncbi:MAG TPA: class I SAM-dependent methyltransferase [Phototrophicaceae bacterium]|nr:class I SAM-dependent methyltransferase [Phototrophicaceae bacterium]
MTSQSDDYKINAVYNREHAEAYGLVYDRDYTAYLKYELLERYAHPAAICLDIGIATGLFAIPLAARVSHIHGIDISPDMITVCHHNLAEAGIQNVTVYEQSATYLDFPDATFDLIYAYATLLFIQDIQTAFQEIVRVLKPGGKAILDIASKHNLSRIRWEYYYHRRADLQIQYFTLPEIQAIWQQLGLEIVETHPTGFLDQWKYVPGLKYLKFINRFTHEARHAPDRDYRVSQRFPRLANRWYFVLSKPDAGRR